MSIKSTYGISREVAQQVLAGYLFKATDEELASMLLDIPESYFRNYRVGSTGYSSDDDSMINSVEEFFSSK